MNRQQRRAQAIDQCRRAIESLQHALILLSHPPGRLEDLEDSLTVASALADAALHTCVDAAHDPDCDDEVTP